MSGPRGRSRGAGVEARQASERLLQVRNLQRREKVDVRGLGRFLERVAAETGADEEASATVVLVRDERMRALNRFFRGKDVSTDVLAFPAGDAVSPEGEDYLGDIVISVETAGRQALDRGLDLESELRVLALHGFLHLLGHDHETDDGEMGRLEVRLRRKLGVTAKKGGVRAGEA